MNKAKKYYIDNKGNMVKSTRHKRDLKEITVEEGYTERKNLKLTRADWQNSGLTFWFKDDENHGYPMSWHEFNDYLREHPVEFNDMNIEFLQQGNVYSIGFVDND